MSLRPAGPPIAGQITPDAVTSILSGAIATALALRAHPVLYFRVKALAANTGKVYIGPTGVTSATGDELSPGESYSVDHSDPGLWFVKNVTAGDKVSVSLVLAG